MIIPINAALVLSGVTHLIKLGNRIDTLLAQHAAVDTQLVLRMPAVALGNVITHCRLVREALDSTAGRFPDPFGDDRAALEAQLALDQPEPLFGQLFEKYFPDQNTGICNPDAAYLGKLEQVFPSLDWSDPGVRIAALALAAGKNAGQTGYSARIALAIADTLLEFGAENSAALVNDPKTRAIMQLVLERFAQPEWGSFESWNPLLQTALKITLNAALDVTRQLPADNPWLASTLDAVAQARSAVPANQQDEYLLGLFRGKGVPILFSQGLLVASDKLDNASASSFRQVVADVLSAAAPALQNAGNQDLVEFFQNHWADLVRASLSSLDKRGDQLLAPGNPLVNSALKALVAQLAATPDVGLIKVLSSESLYNLADTVITTVATNPDEVTNLATKPWLAALINTVAQSARHLTARNLFTPDAADALLRDAIGVIGKYPNLIVKGNGLPVALVSSVFTSVAGLPRLEARTIGETAVRAALSAIAADPTLGATNFGAVITAVSGRLADDVGRNRLTYDQAAELASVAIAAVARNPQLFAGAVNGLAGTVIAAVERALPADADWAARLLVLTAQQTLIAVARNGAVSASNLTLAEFETRLVDVLSAGLKTAAGKLGENTDLDGIPPILGGLVAQVLRGDLTVLDPTSDEFITAFDTIATQLLTA